MTLFTNFRIADVVTGNALIPVVVDFTRNSTSGENFRAAIDQKSFPRESLLP